MAEHRIIKSDYPDEPNLHICRFDDGDYGLAIGEGERAPMGGMTLCSSGGRNLAAWHAVVALFNAAPPGREFR